MLIALTGTPGTGKTSVAKILKKKYRVVEISEIVKKDPSLILYRDEKRNSLVVDIDKLREKMSSYDGIVVGHLSHHLPADLVIVLRTHPEILRKRLSTKNYSEEKIRENIEAEAISLITSECMEMHTGRTYEVDTTEKTPEEVAEIVMKIIEDKEFRKNYVAGKIDYTEVVLNWY